MSAEKPAVVYWRARDAACPPSPNAPPTPTSDPSDEPPQEPTPSAAETIVLGADRESPQLGQLGQAAGRPIALDLSGCHTICLFGVQGFGKSYTLGSIAEMATMPIAGVNVLPAPLGALVFHYHRSESYAPEMLSARFPTNDPAELARLAASGLSPQALTDLVVLTPAAKVAARRRELPGVDVRPIAFGAAEVGADGWRMLLGATGNDALYLRQLIAILRRNRDGLTLARIRTELETADLPAAARRLVDDRLALAAEHIVEDFELSSLFRPGRTVIVDLRDEWVEKDEALALFIVLMRVFAGATHNGVAFNKLVVFDEAHKYLVDSDVMTEVVETIREARHHGTTVLVASQDPISVSRAIIELSSMLILHRMTSPVWLRHLKGAVASLDSISERELASLRPGEALVWSQRATERRFTEKPQKVSMRPRVSRHGGATKTAVRGSRESRPPVATTQPEHAEPEGKS